jgi:UDP-N-acetylglucosamine--N-acetylmuramyl-(pentapeptide) pyrophosphoryl-undecaprenol N-acetylglucosamine transferase
VTALFVASAGGHLLELLELSSRLPDSGTDGVWVTFEGAQSRSLLAGRKVIYVKPSAPRDYRALAEHGLSAKRILGKQTFTQVFSTGSGVAIPFMAVARAKGIACHYIESATRIFGPSLTGRAVNVIPGVHCYTQHSSWSGRGWKFIGSIFDNFEVESRPSAPLRRIVVTVGSSEQFGFRRLIDRVAEILPEGVEALWQTGSTDVTDFPHPTVPLLPALELMAQMQSAEAVVAHAGVGTAFTAMLSGKVPILVPRLSGQHEHIDDHQIEIAAELDRLGLALSRNVEELSVADLECASASTVLCRSDPVKLVLSQ